MRNQKPMSMEELMKDLQVQKTSEDPNETSLDELFHKSFMSKHSSFKNFADFVDKGNFEVNTLQDINNIHDELFDRHVARETDFSDWKSMLDTATKEYNDNK